MLNNYTENDTYRSYHIILSKNNERGNLILGDFNAAVDVQMLNNHQVKTIITAALGFEHLQIHNSYTHIIFPLADVKSQNIDAYFQQSYQIIDQNLKKGGVLVHCGAGISRSATIVIAYYMKKYHQTFKKAITYVRNIRPNICPNLGFQLQLKKYENQLKLKNSPRLEKHNSEKEQKKMSKYQQHHKQSLHNHQKFQPKSINIDIDFRAPETRRSQKKMPQNGKPRQQQIPRSRTRQTNQKNTKRMMEVMQTELFITGKSAARTNQSKTQQFHQVSNKTSTMNSGVFSHQKVKTHKNPLLGTWGPMPKRF